ncbi:MAG: metallophosphoesterase [Mycobacterium leprae]
MWQRRLAALLTATTALAGLVTTTAPAALALTGTAVERGGNPLTFVLIGDVPYGDVQRAQFPALVADVNADPKVRMVLHAGDVKNGGSACSDERFADLTALFDTFEDPFVLTPGDNEWTDCHRTAAGSYLPTERLEAVRHYFFRRPGARR